MQIRDFGCNLRIDGMKFNAFCLLAIKQEWDLLDTDLFWSEVRIAKL